MMKRALLLAVCTAALATSAHATIDFCVVVRNTPDGFLALRKGPGTRFRMKARLKPGELLTADTRKCMGENEPICDEKGQWTFINYVPRLDDGKKERFTQGWVATKFTTQTGCPGEAAAAQSKTPAESAQKTPYERCLAAGDRENNQHVDNCVRRYGNPAEKREWFRSLAEDVCVETTDSKSYKSRASREAAFQRCIKKALQNPAQLCGDYLGIECKK
jgi:hypothetical protein